MNGQDTTPSGRTPEVDTTGDYVGYHIHTGEGTIQGPYGEWEPHRDRIKMCAPEMDLNQQIQRSGIYPEELYKTNCFAPRLEIALPVDAGQVYEVNLHFAELYFQEAARRVFDVEIRSGAQIIGDRIDVFALAGGKDTALVRSHRIVAEEASITVLLRAITDNALISALEIIPLVSPTTHDFLHLNIYDLHDNEKAFSIFSPQTALHIARVEVEDIGLEKAGEAFTLQVGSEDPFTAMETSKHAVDSTVEKGQKLMLKAVLKPTEKGEYKVKVSLLGDDDDILGIFTVIGTGGSSDNPFLHGVVSGPTFSIDWDGDNQESGSFSGDLSHTHEPHRIISGFQWFEKTADSLVPLSSKKSYLESTFALGKHTILLRITDDNPEDPQSLDETHEFSVVHPERVPGAIVLFYTNQEPFEIPPNFQLQDLASADVAKGMRVHANVPGTEKVVVHMFGMVHIGPDASQAQFRVTSSSGIRSWLDVKDGGENEEKLVEVLAYLTDVDSQIPIEVEMQINDGPFESISHDMVSYNQRQFNPVINSLSPEGPLEGGNTVKISGLGWNLVDFSIVVDGVRLPEANIDRDRLSDTEIYFEAPSSATEKVVNIIVESDAGNRMSNAKEYSYKEGSYAAEFTQKVFAPIVVPTVCTWCFGKLYAATLHGDILELEFDEDYELIQQRAIQTLATNSPMRGILGIACGIRGTPENFRIYVAHNRFFMNGGTREGLNVSAPFSGAVSYMEGPQFDVLHPVVSNLGVANFDHVINGLEFDNKGSLLILSGSITNAGIPGDGLGYLDECPTSAAILKADIWKADFDGTLTYKLRTEPQHVVPIIEDLLRELTSTREEAVVDQRFCRYLQVASGDVTVLGHGLRNPLGVVYTTKDQIFTTENGPNAGLGVESISEFVSGGEVGYGDELNLIIEGNYYGSANPSRGYDDPRQFTYVSPSTINPECTQPVGDLPSSSDGIVEYRSEVFGGAWRGDLIIQHFNNDILHYVEDDNGRWRKDEIHVDALPTTPALGVTFAPGGVLLSSSIGRVTITANIPRDPRERSGRPIPLDITPWRDFEAGGSTFIIGGFNFDNLDSVGVAFGGVAVEGVLSKTRKRITGTIPEYFGAPDRLIDITVTGSIVASGNVETFTIREAFRYLKDPAGKNMEN